MSEAKPVPVSEILEFTKKLVSTPSYESEREIAQVVLEKFDELQLPAEAIGGDLQHPSIISFIPKPNSTKTIWFECALDTVPPGDVLRWSFNPLLVHTEGNKMLGLGVADSKIAIALYTYLAKDLSEDPEFHGSLFIGFDSQEQDGNFAGIREIIPYAPKSDICILGYQSFDELHIGARGWLRLKLEVHGKKAHTGTAKKRGVNAIHKMHKAIEAILNTPIQASEPYFEYGSNINISMIEGGNAINIVPDTCTIFIDIRIIPSQKPQVVLSNLHTSLKKIALVDPDFDFTLNTMQAENAYITDPNSPIIQLMQKNYKNIVGNDLILKTSGPGSVGNILSKLDIPIINAFGVDSHSAHSPDEWIDISTIEPVYKIWRQTLIEFCKSESS